MTHDSAAMTDDELMMRRCLELGRIALERDEAPVGALIVLDGLIVAEGIEAVKAKLDPTAHAEVEAVRAACAGLRTPDLSGGTLYTNVEPCAMCAREIRRARLSRIVYGIRHRSAGGEDAEPDASGDTELIDAAVVPTVVAGILRAECEALQRRYEDSKRARS